jgi:hypothetical protein
MSDSEQPVLLRPDRNQRTLFSLAKVVRLDNSSVCFTLEQICDLKDRLLDASLTKHEVIKQARVCRIQTKVTNVTSLPVIKCLSQILTILRKLDCYKLEVEDLFHSQIGIAVATLALQHPKQDVARLAASILDKWQRMVKEKLFHTVNYDINAALYAPDGVPSAPEELIAIEKEQKRLDDLERRRQRIQEDCMAVSTSEDEIDSDWDDPEWEPLSKRKASIESSYATPNPNIEQGSGPVWRTRQSSKIEEIDIANDDDGQQKNFLGKTAKTNSTRVIRPNHILNLLQKAKS